MKIEVSIGEVVDKITILQIKKEKIDNEAKLKYINEELTILNETLKKENIEVPDGLVQNLKKVNKMLWETEDIIRLKEKNSAFDEDFVKHARLDAILNDKRFLAKNEINNYCNSQIKEQKSYEGLYTAD
jgi:hypothetical protein|tara:strand:+ start:21 stop:407 length:387 start_codon:yes stop_codon:yes gene_type:complete